MKIGRFAMQLECPLIGCLLLTSVWPARVLAQHDQMHTPTSLPHESTPDQKNQTSAFVKLVRESTERVQDVSMAEAEGYVLQFGCVSGPDAGAMGLHFVKGSLVGDDVVDAARPEIVIYEPLSNGRMRLIGADFLVLKDLWDAKHAAPPELMGQLFHFFEAPNRFGLPPFYTLHVWAWKDNPNGTFTNWNPSVSCDGFNPEHP